MAVDDGTVALPLTIVEDSVTPLNLLGNDIDVDSDVLMVKSINGVDLTPGVAQSIPVSNGVVTVAVDGSLSFTPALDYNGSVSFDYVVTDPQGLTDIGTVNLNVTPVNDAPVAVDDKALVIEDKIVIGNLLGNDTDIDRDPLNVTSARVDINGDGLTDLLPLGVTTLLRDSTGEPIGKITINANGSFSFMPAPNYNGLMPVVEYTIDDGHGGIDTGTLTLGPVEPVNDNPIAKNDANTVTEDTPLVVSATDGLIKSALAVEGVDNDIDGDILTLTVVMVDTNGDGTPDVLTLDVATPLVDKSGQPIGILVVKADGSYSFTPEHNYTGLVPDIHYTVNDGHGGSADATLILTLEPVNDPPVAVDDTIEVLEDTPVSGNVLNNDSDVDGDSLTVIAATVDTNGDGLPDPLILGEVALITDKAGTVIGSLTLNSDGSFTFAPALNYFGPVPDVKYTVSDGHGAVDVATLKIGPVISALDPIDDPGTGEIDTPIIVDILANDPSVNPNTIQIVGTQNPGDSLLVPGEGTWTIDPKNGLLTFTPLPTFHAAPSPIHYTVTDTNGLVSSAALVKINIQPVVSDDIVIGATPDVPVIVDVLANDKGADPATVKIVDATNVDGSLIIPGEGTWTVDKTTGQITFTPISTFHGDPAPIRYTVSSLTGLPSPSAGVTIHVQPVGPEIGSLIMLSNPQPPLFTLPSSVLPFTSLPVRPLTPMWEQEWFKPVDLSFGDSADTCDLYLVGSLKNQVVIERQSYHFSIPSGTFRHTNPSEQLEYSATHPDGSPLPEWLEFNPKTLTFSGVPPKGAVSETVMVTVRDDCGDEVHATFFVKMNKEHYRHTSHDKHHAVNKGKLGLGKQLHAAGKMGKLQNGRELLDSLSAEQDGKNVTILKSQKG
ncbi:hypothetical protein CRENPOLYSF2_3180006 [Crenothrix polyspora]|uniref:Dystroglycan-type cadherin-like domain-containing protein n=2 Tax=Crenothrix polyspora TaxID=360316 RepID=A0A1R4HB42_9GAMM|nr:hypothetical protein CRENPOLYSF2_3180006 [Crenothrix polyspora]